MCYLFNSYQHVILDILEEIACINAAHTVVEMDLVAQSLEFVMKVVRTGGAVHNVEHL